MFAEGFFIGLRWCLENRLARSANGIRATWGSREERESQGGGVSLVASVGTKIAYGNLRRATVTNSFPRGAAQ